MWPFKKKTAWRNGAIANDEDLLWDFYHTRLHDFPDQGRLAAAKLAIEMVEKFKRERRKAKKGKMKLELNKWYELEGLFGFHKCTPSASFTHPYDVGGFSYKVDGLAAASAPRILRCAEPPRALIPGELYAMENGKVERCRGRDSFHDAYEVGGHWYKKDGSPAWLGCLAPKILHRLRVNEHMKTQPPGDTLESDTIRYHLHNIDGGRLFSDRVKEAEAMMKRVTPAMARTLRPSLDEIIARHEASTTAKKLMQEQAATEALAAMPRVTYRNVRSETKACKREVVVPEGYESVTAAAALPRDLTPAGGEWRPINRAWDGGPYIRPITKPFKVDGAGWYRTRGGAWVKNPQIERPALKKWNPWWGENGVWLVDGEESDLDLISRATAEQAAILDAL